MILSALTAIGPVPMSCCTYVERVLGRAYGPTVVAAGGTENWNLWESVLPTDPWSPVTAAALSGVGTRVEAPVVGAWHVVQGWRTAPSVDGSGHTFLLYVGLHGACLLADAVSRRAADLRHVALTELHAEFGHGLRFARLRRGLSAEG